MRKLWLLDEGKESQKSGMFNGKREHFAGHARIFDGILCRQVTQSSDGALFMSVALIASF
ncbi:hypothetical protein PYCC9005_004005 [Savitreella phatthalungensis]